jgi:hypothetical protein
MDINFNYSFFEMYFFLPKPTTSTKIIPPNQWVFFVFNHLRQSQHHHHNNKSNHHHTNDKPHSFTSETKQKDQSHFFQNQGKRPASPNPQTTPRLNLLV